MKRCQQILPKHVELCSIEHQSKSYVIWQVWDSKRQQKLAWKMPKQKCISNTLEEQILRQDIHEQIPYFVEALSFGFLMQWIDGNNLYEAKQKTNTWSEKQCVIYGCSMLEILCAIHQHGYVHLDIKPQNFMIDKNHNIYLIDFGSVHEIGESVPVFYGTPFYASQNMYHTNIAKISFDLYAFAKTILVLYHKQIPQGKDATNDEIWFPVSVNAILTACLKEEIEDSMLVYETFLFAYLKQMERSRRLKYRCFFILQVMLFWITEMLI